MTTLSKPMTVVTKASHGNATISTTTKYFRKQPYTIATPGKTQHSLPKMVEITGNVLVAEGIGYHKVGYGQYNVDHLTSGRRVISVYGREEKVKNLCRTLAKEVDFTQTMTQLRKRDVVEKVQAIIHSILTKKERGL